MKITITGASDDLIEIDGDIHEEFTASSQDVEEGRSLLAFSNGALLRVRYDQDGIWRFDVMNKGDNLIEQRPGITSEDTFDVIELTTEPGREIEWIIFADSPKIIVRKNP